MPASRSFLRWCESVGWETAKSGTSSHTQTFPACLRSTSTSCRRIGSPSALATSAIRAARAGSTSGKTSGSQHASPAARLLFGASSNSTGIYLQVPIELIFVNGMSHVLFVCLHNAGRSQMSQALFARAAAGRHSAESAGSVADPEGHVHPEVVDAMRELGIDLSKRRPQRLTQELAERADIVVTMGCGDTCPYIPGRRYLDWDLPDPKGRPLDE